MNMKDKEQTISNLRKLKSFHNGSYGADIDKAIEALEQEPCDDCVRRQAVLDEMYKRRADGDAITAGFIKNLPSVTPQPKIGHWIGDGNYICSCCKCNPVDEFLEPLGLDGGSYMSVPMKYCPNCGAKMIGFS